MSGYNKQFEFTIDDLELIEDALHRSKRALSDCQQGEAAQADEDLLRDIHDLLGRIHNQKVFFRPREETFISG